MRLLSMFKKQGSQVCLKNKEIILQRLCRQHQRTLVFTHELSNLSVPQLTENLTAPWSCLLTAALLLDVGP